MDIMNDKKVDIANNNENNSFKKLTKTKDWCPDGKLLKCFNEFLGVLGALGIGFGVLVLTIYSINIGHFPFSITFDQALMLFAISFSFLMVYSFYLLTGFFSVYFMKKEKLSKRKILYVIDIISSIVLPFVLLAVFILVSVVFYMKTGNYYVFMAGIVILFFSYVVSYGKGNILNKLAWGFLLFVTPLLLGVMLPLSEASMRMVGALIDKADIYILDEKVGKAICEPNGNQGFCVNNKDQYLIKGTNILLTGIGKYTVFTVGNEGENRKYIVETDKILIVDRNKK